MVNTDSSPQTMNPCTNPHQDHVGSPPRHPRRARRICLLLASAQLAILPLPAAGEAAGPDAEKAALTALESTLVATLQEATLIGRWHPVANGEVGAERSDRYSIAGAEKVADDRWIIRARLSPAMPDLVIPVPLRIEWAGDSAVLIVDNFGLPDANPYSARVLIHGDAYAGTWSGGGMAGLISGVIVRETAEPAEPTPDEAEKDKQDAPTEAG
jgi:hypothetical protein